MENRMLTVIKEQPAEVIETAQLAAKELTHIVSSRPNKLVINNKQYLYFEDWQTLGKFYGIAARVLSTEEMVKGKIIVGYLAKAAAVNNGYEVSAAEAQCTNDEPNWKSKPMFQLRSMAQTRACSKALRNCLGWVAVLAGYEAMPAEEIAQEINNGTNRKLLTNLVEIARSKGYNKEEVLNFYGVERLSELTTEQAAHLIAMMKSNEPLKQEVEW